MDFKEKLITEIKKYPDLFNEIRVEIIASKWQSELEDGVEYIVDTEADQTLEKVEEEQLVDSIINNLKYYIEYERELGESEL
ncbi:hypothetical protein MWH28_06245 [Natroniella sulfidigena]|uniref:hypothetical protein n=1 Tax=Natroniella sulfidigena TaxID=723921 RepID=UPI00200AE5FE|nr:hypothetical protein [Natroniella sulfidigena]MCK8816973.1 hypothetical protein [Natroniella sulfidigena]